MSKKATKGIPLLSKIPTSGHDSGTHSRSSSVSNLTTASDTHSEAGDVASEAAHNFKLDDRVWVNGTKPGCLKFLGKTEFAPGTWAGVELDEPVGKNDGSVAGVKYFSCKPLKGIFTRPQKLTRSPGPLPETGDSPAASIVTPRPGVFSSRASVCSNSSISTPRVCSKLKVNERVAVSSTTGVKSGILKFVGETDFAKGEWAGIELDEPVGKNDGSVAGKRYFTCEMKHGLFAPLHKVSRAGGASVSRTSSVRGTPLTRSASKDSLSSSVSNCSRSSRVKLGVTSLTSTQKARSPGTGIMTNSRALEEILKEKEQYINQLLKDRDLDRAQVVRVANQYEQIEVLASELKKTLQKMEEDRKSLEEQLSIDKRKFEDLQFQLEEEKIVKTDLELQLQQNTAILKRIEEFSSQNSDGKIVNIKEILEGKENLSPVDSNQESKEDAQNFKNKIAELEDNLKRMLDEKNKVTSEVTELQKMLKDTIANNEHSLSSLTASIQEKDDIISNLKAELNSQFERIEKVLEENKSLNEQLVTLAAQSKGQTDEVMKELGEKINLLTEENKRKTSLLEENDNLIKEKDQNVSKLSQSLEAQAALLSELESNKTQLTHALEQRDVTLAAKVSEIKASEDEILSLKNKVESEISEKEEKILGLIKDIERLSNCLQEKEDEALQKQKEIDDLIVNVNEIKTVADQLKDKLQNTEEKLLTASKDSCEQVNILQNEVACLKEECKNKDLESTKKLENVQKELEAANEQSQLHQSKIGDLQSQISSLKVNLNEITTEYKRAENELSSSKDANSVLLKEKEDILKLQRQAEEDLQKAQEQLRIEAETLLLKDNLTSEQEREITTLKEQIQNLITESGQMKNELVASKDDYENLQKKNTESMNALKSKEDDLQKVQEQLRIEAETLLLKDNLTSEQEREITTLKEQIQNLITESGQMKNELVASKDDYENLQKKNSESMNALKSKEDIISALQNEIDSFKKSLRKVTQDLQQDQKKTNSLQDCLRNMEEENKQLVSKLQLAEQKVDLLNKDSSDHVMSLQNELSKVKEEGVASINQLQQNLQKVQEELKNQTEKLQIKENLTSEQESEITVLKERVHNLATESSQVKEELVSSKEDYNQLQKENVENLSILKLKEKLVLDLQNETEITKESLQKATQNLQEEGLKIESLQNCLRNMEEEKKELLAKVGVAEEKIQLLNKDSNDQVMSLQNELSKVKEDSIASITQLEQNVQKLQAEITKSSEVIEERTCCLKEKEDLCLVLQNNLQGKEAELSKLTAELQNLQLEISNIRENKDKLVETQGKELLAMKAEFENELKKKDQNVQKLQAEITKSSEVIEERTCCLKEKEDLCLVLQKNLQGKEAELSKLTAELQNLQLEISNIRENKDKLVETQGKELLAMKAEFENELKKKDQLFDAVHTELISLKELESKHVEELSKKEAEKRKLMEIINEKESQFDELTEAIEASQAQLVKLMENNEQNVALLKSKEGFILDFKAEQQKQLEEKELSFKNENLKLLDEIQSKDAEIKGKEDMLSAALSNLEDQEKIIDSLKSEKEKTDLQSKQIYEEFHCKLHGLEEKYCKLLTEKEELAKEELKNRDAKKNLELMRDSLLKENAKREEMVKDKETQLEALQAMVNRMQADFMQHKQELEHKLDVSDMELQATMELKNQLELQHSVNEELQQELSNSEAKCKSLQDEVQNIAAVQVDKNQMQKQIEEYERTLKVKSEKMVKFEDKIQFLEEQLSNSKNLFQLKEKEMLVVNEQLQAAQKEEESLDVLKASLKLFEEENKALKNKVLLLEASKPEKNSNISAEGDTNQTDVEEKDSLYSQIDFLNSIIVDMKQKNEDLTEQLELQTTCWDESDVNLNTTKKKLAPRLFCDICDMFDLHDTEECPKQESSPFEEIPNMRDRGPREVPERLYCNKCEIFDDHWTYDCQEQDTY